MRGRMFEFAPSHEPAADMRLPRRSFRGERGGSISDCNACPFQFSFDQIVEWFRPVDRPAWTSEEKYPRCPSP